MPNKNSFSSKTGFYELPYLLHSPQDMIESYKKLPFIKTNIIRQYLFAKMPVLDIKVYYRDIEEGLYLIYSEVKFKANVSFRHQDNKLKPSKYYCLSLRIDRYAKVINSMADGISYTDNTWLIFKPGAKVDHYHFKGTKGNYISVYFTVEWLEQYMSSGSMEDQKLLELFLKSDYDYLICPNLPGGSLTYDIDSICKPVESVKTVDKKHLQTLKQEILGFFSAFILKMRTENINEHHFNVSNLERIKVLMAEKILRDHLYNKFPGINYIAREAGLSETKLKECFKIMYHKTLYKYFQALQMDEAKELILHSDLQIWQIALKFGYEHAGKFSLAFKTCHGLSPSQIKKTVG